MRKEVVVFNWLRCKARNVSHVVTNVYTYNGLHPVAVLSLDVTNDSGKSSLDEAVSITMILRMYKVTRCIFENRIGTIPFVGKPDFIAETTESVLFVSVKCGRFLTKF